MSLSAAQAEAFENRSARWRRACAMHYARRGTPMVTPALDYDPALVATIT